MNCKTIALMLTCLSFSLFAADIDTNLVGYWPLDEGAGTSTVDASVNSNSGTVQNSSGWVSGKFGAAIDANAGNVLIGNPSAVDITGDISLAAWIKIGSTSSNAYMRILSKKAVWDQASGYELEYNPSSNRLSVSGGGGDIAYALNVDLDTNWHHVAAVVSGTSAQLYVDGIAVTMTDANVGAIISGTDTLRIGSLGNGSSAFNGHIDEVRIYNAVVSATVMEALANPALQNAPDPDLHWKLDEGAGSAVSEENSGPTGTLSGGTWSTDATRADYIHFDGIDDHILFADQSDLDFVGNKSIAFWMKIDDPSSAVWQRVMSKKQDGGETAGWEIVHNGNSNLLQFVGQGENVAQTTIDLDTNWHHIVFAKGGNDVHIYVDGEPLTMGIINVGTISDSTLPLYVGRLGNGYGDFDGGLDDIKIFNKTLSAAEALSLFTAAPLNNAPVASNDTWSLNEGATLNQSQNVLDNDTDADEDSLTAVLVVGPSHASTFVLNTDGTFTYQHDGSELINDSFTYRANDGADNSLTATVSLTIVPINDAPDITSTAPNNAVVVGGSFTYQVQVSDPDNIQSELTYQLSGEPVGMTVSSTGLVAWATSAAGTYGPITLTVNDGGTTPDTEIFQVSVISYSGPVAEVRWQCNEGSGTVVNDSGSDGAAVNGVLANGTWVAGGGSGPANAISFNGSSTQITIPDNNALDVTGDFTFTFWLKVGNPNQALWSRIVSKKTSDTQQTGYEIVYHPLNNQLQFVGQGGNVAYTVYDFDANWHHVAMVITGNQALIYVDGVAQTMSSNVCGWVSAGTEDLYIGVMGGGYGDFLGDLSDISIFREALTQADIDYLINPSSNVNIAPTITSSPILNATEDVAYNYQVTVNDPDDSNNGTDLLWSLSNEPAGMVISATGLITWTPAEGVATSGVVSVQVADGGEDGSVPDIQDFTIAVTAVNDAPSITSSAILNATEDVVYSYQVAVNDPDDSNNGTDLLWSLSNEPAGMVISTNGLITWTPTEGVVTSGIVYVQVADGGEDGSVPDSQDFTIAVTAVNDAPSISSVAPITGTEGVLYEYTATVVDADDANNGTDLVWSLLNAPTGMSVSTIGVVSWTPGVGVGTSGAVTLQVVDGGEDGALAATENFTITVDVANNAPVVQAGADVVHNTALGAYALQGIVNDDGLPVGEIITSVWALVSGPGTVNFGDAGLPATTVTFSTTGIYILQLSANDSQLTASDEVEISVIDEVLPTVSLAMRAPTANNIFLEEDEGVFIFDVEVLGNISSDLVITIQASGSAINGSDYTLSVPQLTFNAPGIQQFTVSIVDDALFDSYETIDLILSGSAEIAGNVIVTIKDAEGLPGSENPVNVPPQIISPTPTADASEGVLYTYQVVVSDPDDQNGAGLTYELNPNPNGMTISATGLISWTPAEGETSGSATVIVTDSAAHVVTQNISITVNEINDAPEITSTPQAEAVLGQAYTYTLVVDDEESATVLNYVVTSNSIGSTVTMSNNVLSWTPNKYQSSVLMTVLVTDAGGLQDFQTWNVTLTPPAAITIAQLELHVDDRAGVEYEAADGEKPHRYYATEFELTFSGSIAGSISQCDGRLTLKGLVRGEELTKDVDFTGSNFSVTFPLVQEDVYELVLDVAQEYDPQHPATASSKTQVIVDRTGPQVTILSQEQWGSLGSDKQLVGPENIEVILPEHSQTERKSLRNVIKLDDFTIALKLSDDLSGFSEVTGENQYKKHISLSANDLSGAILNEAIGGYDFTFTDLYLTNGDATPEIKLTDKLGNQTILLFPYSIKVLVAEDIDCTLATYAPYTSVAVSVANTGDNFGPLHSATVAEVALQPRNGLFVGPTLALSITPVPLDPNFYEQGIMRQGKFTNITWSVEDIYGNMNAGTIPEFVVDSNEIETMRLHNDATMQESVAYEWVLDGNGARLPDDDQEFTDGSILYQDWTGYLRDPLRITTNSIDVVHTISPIMTRGLWHSTYTGHADNNGSHTMTYEGRSGLSTFSPQSYSWWDYHFQGEGNYNPDYAAPFSNLETPIWKTNEYYNLYFGDTYSPDPGMNLGAIIPSDIQKSYFAKRSLHNESLDTVDISLVGEFPYANESLNNYDDQYLKVDIAGIGKFSWKTNTPLYRELDSVTVADDKITLVDIGNRTDYIPGTIELADLVPGYKDVVIYYSGSRTNSVLVDHFTYNATDTRTELDEFDNEFEIEMGDLIWNFDQDDGLVNAAISNKRVLNVIELAKESQYALSGGIQNMHLLGGFLPGLSSFTAEYEASVGNSSSAIPTMVPRVSLDAEDVSVVGTSYEVLSGVNGGPDTVEFGVSIPIEAAGFYDLKLTIDGTEITIEKALLVDDLAIAFDRNRDGTIDRTTDGATSVHLTQDANADGIIDKLDEPFLHQVDGIIVAGFGLPNTPAFLKRFPIKLYASLETGETVALQNLDSEYPTKNENVFQGTGNALIFDTETATEPIVDLSWSFGEVFPKTVWVECNFSAESLLRLEKVRNSEGVSKFRDFRFAYHTNGLGRDDGLAPVANVAPGLQVNLVNGNLSALVPIEVFNTPRTGPNSFLSYNHQDLTRTSLGNAWRSNYDQRIYDGSWNQTTGDNKDAEGIRADDRKDDDLLVWVDDTGRRHLFLYSVAESKFIAEEHSMNPGAYVEADVSLPNTGLFASLSTKQRKSAYKLYAFDNTIKYFERSGLLLQIEMLNGETIDIDRLRPNGRLSLAPVSIKDGFDRESALTSKEVFKGNVIDSPVFGRWSFSYQGVDELTNTVYRISKWACQENKEDKSVWLIDGYSDYNQGNGVESFTSIGNRAYQIIRTPTTIDSPLTKVEITGPRQSSVTYEDLDLDLDVWKKMTVEGAGTNSWESPDVVVTRTMKADARRLATVTQGQSETTFDYDDKGNATSVEVEEGTSTTYVYDSFGMDGANLLKTSTLEGAGGDTTYIYGTSGGEAGLVKKITDPCGDTIDYGYDGNGNMTSMTDKRSNTTIYSLHDLYGNVGKAENATNRTTSFTYYDSGVYGDLQTVNNWENYAVSYAYDNAHRLISTTYPGSVTETTSYDYLGRVVSQKDVNGAISSSSYDNEGRLFKTTSAGLPSTTTVFTDVGNTYTAKTTDSKGRVLSDQVMDNLGRVLISSHYMKTDLVAGAVERKDTIFKYNDEGLAYETVDPIGNVYATVYDKSGKVKTQTAPGNATTTYAYFPHGQIETIETPDNAVMAYTYDPCLRPLEITSPLGGKTVYTYEGGLVKTTTQANGASTTAEYDDNNEVFSVTDNHTNTQTIQRAYRQVSIGAKYKEGGPTVTTVANKSDRGFTEDVQTASLPKTSMEQFPDGATKTTKVTTNLHGEVAVYGVNARTPYGTPTSTTSAGATSSVFISEGEYKGATTARGNQITVETDAATGQSLLSKDSLTAANADNGKVLTVDGLGRTLTSQDAMGRVWSTVYNDAQRQAITTAPDGVTTTTIRTPGGRTDSVTVSGGALSQTTSYTYNDAGQPLTITYPDTSTVVNTYDNAGRIKTTTSKGLPTTYNYVADRLQSINHADGLTETLVYDSVGNVLQRNVGGRVWGFEQDDLGRTTSSTFPDLKSTSVRYNTDGLIDQVTDRSQVTTNINEFDQYGRPKKVQRGQIPEFSLDYDLLGSLISVQGDGSSSIISRDKRGRQTLQMSSGTDLTTLAYRNDGSTESVTGPNQFQNQFTYDQNTGRLLSMIVDGQTATVTEFDALGRVKELSFPNNVTKSFEYDSANRTTNITERKSGTIISSWVFDFDVQTGRLKSSTGTNIVKSYTYDGVGRLKTETAAGTENWYRTYDYDAFSNRTSLIASDIRYNYFLKPLVHLNELSGDWTLDQSQAVADMSVGSLIASAEVVIADEYPIVLSEAILSFGVNTELRAGFEIHTEVSQAPKQFRYLLEKRTGGAVYLVCQQYDGNTSSWLDLQAAVAVTASTADYQAQVNHVGNQHVFTVVDSSNVTSTLAQATFNVSSDEWTSVRLYVDGDAGTQVTYTQLRVQTKQPGRTMGYTYDVNNRLISAVDSSDSSIESYSYTLAGALEKYKRTIGGTLVHQRRYTYDHYDRLKIVSEQKSDASSESQLVAFEYHGMTNKISQATDAAGSTTFESMGGKIIRAKNGTNVETFARIGGRTQWTKDQNSDIVNVLSGEQNDNAGTVDSDGNIERTVYDADGKAYARNSDGERAEAKSGPGYRGLWQHGPSGLVIMGFRVYDPLIGRFLTEDPAQAGHNYYAYAGGDPINRWDPTGLNWIWNGSSWTEDFIFDPDVPKPVLGFRPEDNGGSDRFTFDEIPNFIGYLSDNKRKIAYNSGRSIHDINSAVRESTKYLKGTEFYNWSARGQAVDDFIAGLQLNEYGLLYGSRVGQRQNKKLFLDQLGLVNVDPANIAILEALPENMLSGAAGGLAEVVEDKYEFIKSLEDPGAILDAAISGLKKVDPLSLTMDDVGSFAAGMVENEFAKYQRRVDKYGDTGAVYATLTVSAITYSLYAFERGVGPFRKFGGGYDPLQDILHAKSKRGNFNIGSLKRGDIDTLGKTWVGDGAVPMLNKQGVQIGWKRYDGDRLKTYRYPETKKNGIAAGKTQANMSEFIQLDNGKWDLLRNAHIDLIP